MALVASWPSCPADSNNQTSAGGRAQAWHKVLQPHLPKAWEVQDGTAGGGLAAMAHLRRQLNARALKQLQLQPGRAQGWVQGGQDTKRHAGAGGSVSCRACPVTPQIPKRGATAGRGMTRCCRRGSGRNNQACSIPAAPPTCATWRMAPAAPPPAPPRPPAPCSRQAAAIQPAAPRCERAGTACGRTGLSAACGRGNTEVQRRPAGMLARVIGGPTALESPARTACAG